MQWSTNGHLWFTFLKMVRFGDQCAFTESKYIALELEVEMVSAMLGGGAQSHKVSDPGQAT